MKHKVWFDSKNGILREEFHGPITLDMLPGYFDKVVELFKDKQHRYSLIDLAHADDSLSDKKIRKELLEQAKRVMYQKVAYIGMKPFQRMLVRAVLASGKVLARDLSAQMPEVKFCKTIEEAVEWLKGEKV